MKGRSEIVMSKSSYLQKNTQAHDSFLQLKELPNITAIWKHRSKVGRNHRFWFLVNIHQLHELGSLFNERLRCISFLSHRLFYSAINALIGLAFSCYNHLFREFPSETAVSFDVECNNIIKNTAMENFLSRQKKSSLLINDAIYFIFFRLAFLL